MHILVVDDDATTRLVVAKMLEAQGHDVADFEDGEDALHYYENYQAQIIVTDWLMEPMNGLELCRRVRKEVRDTYTFIIVMTALSGTDKIIEALEAGADDFMTKPVDSKELAARIKVAERIQGLRKTVSHLEALLPVCSYCKRIREEETGGGDKWTEIEQYVSHRTEASFSHGVCPDCYEKKLKPEIDGLG